MVAAANDPGARGGSRAARWLLAPARPRRLLLVAGEASGDLHGADLVRVLRASVPDLEVFGVGGERLREAGMETVADVGQGATMGLKATGRLRALWHAYRTLARRLRADPPGRGAPCSSSAPAGSPGSLVTCRHSSTPCAGSGRMGGCSFRWRSRTRSRQTRCGGACARPAWTSR